MRTKLTAALPALGRVLFLGGLLLAGGQSAAAAELASYQAVYKVTLASIDDDRTVAWSKGALAMRLVRDCRKWQAQTEMFFGGEFDDGSRFRHHTMSRVRESLDGRAMEYSGWREITDTARFDFSGSARLKAAGGAGAVTVVQPRKRLRQIPEGVVFPIGALKSIIEKLTGGDAGASVSFFEESGEFARMSAIQAQPVILQLPPRGDAALVEGRSWQLRIDQIFEDEDKNRVVSQNPDPPFTVLQVHASGVASYIIANLGDGRRVTATLVEVRAIPEPKC